MTHLPCSRPNQLAAAACGSCLSRRCCISQAAYSSSSALSQLWPHHLASGQGKASSMSHLAGDPCNSRKLLGDSTALEPSTGPAYLPMPCWSSTIPLRCSLEPKSQALQAPPRQSMLLQYPLPARLADLQLCSEWTPTLGCLDRLGSHGCQQLLLSPRSSRLQRCKNMARSPAA